MAPHKHTSLVGDALIFLAGASSALILFWAFSSVLFPSSSLTSILSSSTTQRHPTLNHYPPSFYDDPSLGYTIDSNLTLWDEKRLHWLDLHPQVLRRVLLLSGSQPGPCANPIGDHLLLRLLKNKGDYCRLHGCDLFYNMALFHGRMGEYWSKIPTIRAAMVAHPEAEWIWWIDADAVFTDMHFKPPLQRYKNHNLVVHGWPSLVFDKKSWTSLNAGVFLIRNCQWSLDFMAAWAAMGPQTPNYAQWGKTLKSHIKDKLYPDSDDQTGLVYLLTHDETWRDKIYLENQYYFEGYWIEIVPRFENMTKRYREIEKKVAALRQRRAESEEDAYGERWEVELEREGVQGGVDGLKRPFITHFTGCQPCSGKHNEMYQGKQCWDGMGKALDFADDQILRNYGFEHVRDSAAAAAAAAAAVKPLPFDYPKKT